MKKILSLMLVLAISGCAQSYNEDLLPSDVEGLENTEAQQTIAVGTPLAKVSLDDNFTKIQDNFVDLYSDDCNVAKPIFYKLNLGGSDPDGGPAFIDDELTYAKFGDFEVEPMWNFASPRVPWKLEPTNAKHWWGHPGFDRWGRIMISSDGNGYWATNGGPPLYEFAGPVAWDYVNRKLVAQPLETTYPQVLIEKSISYTDFNAWSDFFVSSNNGKRTGDTDEDRWIVTGEYNKTNDNGNDWRMVAYHHGEVDPLLKYHYSSNDRIAQSPDGTKVSYAVTFLTTPVNTGDLAYAVAYNPHPPEIVSVTNGVIRFDWGTDRTVSRGYTQRGWPDEATDDPPPPRETKQFRLWKSADGTTGWEPVAVLNANIFERYNFSTGTWLTNRFWEITDPDPGGYYAVTAVEWSGLESKVLSNVFSSTGVQTAAYPADPKSGNGITDEFNNALTRYYNIYANDGTNPTITQQRRIASVSAALEPSYVDWLGNPDGTTKYIVTAVDSQGNESAALESTATHKLSPATADGQYTIAWTGEGVPQVPVDPEDPIDPEPTCFDGVQNGTETGIDCGGSCAACPPDPEPVGSKKYKFGGLLRSVTNELP